MSPFSELDCGRLMQPTHEQRLAVRSRPPHALVMRQRWSRLLFLHWEFPKDLLASTLPKGLHLDTYEGRAYLGVVPFFMERVRPVGFPSLPWLSNFLELNLRTYVHDDSGRPGVWFYTLDCNQPLAVEIARKLFHLPYQHASMSAAYDGKTTYYLSSRSRFTRQNNPALLRRNGVIPAKPWKTDASHSSFLYRPSGPEKVASPGQFEFFLLERYLLFSVNRRGRLFTGQVHHRPYPYHEAEVDLSSTRIFVENGFDSPADPPVSALYSPGVEVEIFPLRGRGGKRLRRKVDEL
ncbi:MAG: DUF2071 domain-containing protein [Verrucomicrobiota bacterium JB023]|nr:DUF2071 domain-containing protein [Verrucomicrobiota bacterium JB023]